MLARSAFAQEAVIAAAEEARRRLGRDLPPPPQSVSRILCKAVDLFTFSGGFYRWGLMRSG